MKAQPKKTQMKQTKTSKAAAPKSEAKPKATKEPTLTQIMAAGRKENTEKFRTTLLEFLLKHQGNLDAMFDRLMEDSPRDAARFMVDVMKFVVPGLQTVDANKKEQQTAVPEWKKKLLIAQRTMEEE